MSHSTGQDVLLEFLDSHAGPGFEHSLAEKVTNAFAKFSPEVHTDTLGNLVMKISGQGEGRRPRIMLTAHMDEIALVVTKIDEGGFLRVAQSGGFDPRTLVGQEVVVHAKSALRGIIGSKPPHLTSPAERNQAAPLEDLFIDVAMKKSRVEELVNVGDRITLYRESMHLLGDRISGKALDNRTSLAVLYECLGFLEDMKHTADVYVVGTVQEEIGSRGAETVAYGIHPDIAIAIDVTFADMPGQAPDDSHTMGKGAVITFGPNIHPKVFSGLRDMATKHHIGFQIELSQGPTATDAEMMQMAREGIACGVVGIPIRYMHTSVETGAYGDISECGRLLAHYIASLNVEHVEELTCY